ncbi:MAG TPA: transposase [Candidatus Sulfotelmatobacter sp.]
MGTKKALCRESYARLFLKTMYGYRRQGRFELHGFVLMLEHIHLLVTPSPGITLERAIQHIKGGYSHAITAQLGRKGEVWQRGFTDHRIRYSSDFEIHRIYIMEIQSSVGWLIARWSIGIAPRIPDSSWTAGPQRLKPRDPQRPCGTNELVPFPNLRPVIVIQATSTSANEKSPALQSVTKH